MLHQQNSDLLIVDAADERGQRGGFRAVQPGRRFIEQQ